MFQEMINPISSLQGFFHAQKPWMPSLKMFLALQWTKLKSFKIGAMEEDLPFSYPVLHKGKIYTWTYTDTEYPPLDFIHTT